MIIFIYDLYLVKNRDIIDIYSWILDQELCYLYDALEKEVRIDSVASSQVISTIIDNYYFEDEYEYVDFYR